MTHPHDPEPEDGVQFIPTSSVLSCASGEIAKLFLTTDDGVESLVALAMDIIHPISDDIVRAIFGLDPADAWHLGDGLCDVAVSCGFVPEETS